MGANQNKAGQTARWVGRRQGMSVYQLKNQNGLPKGAEPRDETGEVLD